MTAPPGRERRQFRALVRLFAYRFFDIRLGCVGRWQAGPC